MSRRRKKSGGIFSGFVAVVLSLVVFICLTGLIGVISMEQMVPGDLAFVVENGQVTHVGIFYGWMEDGTPRYIRQRRGRGSQQLHGI